MSDSFQNNIDQNLAKKLTEVQRPDLEPIPDVLIERCKKNSRHSSDHSREEIA